jgi:hypothetical protein
LKNDKCRVSRPTSSPVLSDHGTPKPPNVKRLALMDQPGSNWALVYRDMLQCRTGNEVAEKSRQVFGLGRAKMSSSSVVRISFKDGPVTLKNGTGTVDRSFSLSNGIIASEFFPATSGSANYVLSLERVVKTHQEVREAEQELTKTLLMIAAAWPFSGGSQLMIETRQQIISTRFDSNADTVEQELLKRAGLQTVTAQSTVPLEFGTTYACAPLARAVSVIEEMNKHYRSYQLLTYYQAAHTDRLSWFISLYKILDVLKALRWQVPSSELSYFERMLNNHDLRHAAQNAEQPAIGATDINELFEVARRWIDSYLRTRNLSEALPRL